MIGSSFLVSEIQLGCQRPLRDHRPRPGICGGLSSSAESDPKCGRHNQTFPWVISVLLPEKHLCFVRFSAVPAPMNLHPDEVEPIVLLLV